MTIRRDDPFQNLSTTQFQEEIEKPSTFELTSFRLLTCEQNKELAILRVQGQEGSRHQSFDQRKSREDQFSVSRDDLVSMLQDCLRHLHETPEDRIADSLERIEGHLQRMGQSA